MGAVPGLGEHTDAVLARTGVDCRGDRPAARRRSDRTCVAMSESTGAVVVGQRRRPDADPEPARPQERDQRAAVGGAGGRAARRGARYRVASAGDHRCGRRVLLGRGHRHPEDIHPRHKLRRLTDVALALHELTVPTIAKVTGVAVGAGWNLALGCDFVVATPESRFCQIFSKRGLSVDLGGSWLLPKLVGLQQAKRLVLLADMIDADEARRWGWSPGSSRPTRSTRSSPTWPAGWPQGRPSPWRRARRCSTTAPTRRCARRWPTRPARSRAISRPQTPWRRTRRSPRSGTGVHWTMGRTHPDRSEQDA